MASDVEIVNLALVTLGQEPIVSFTDSSKQARIANRTYAMLRDDLMTKYTWNFCRTYALLPALASAPVFKYPYTYQLPDDLLTLEIASVGGPNDNGVGQPGLNMSDYVGDQQQDYELVANNRINTWIAPPLKIIYFVRLTDPNQFDPSFRQTLAAYLAWRWAKAITGSDSQRQACAQEFRESVVQASANDSIQNAPKAIADDSFMASRLRG